GAGAGLRRLQQKSGTAGADVVCESEERRAAARLRFVLERAGVAAVEAQRGGVHSAAGDPARLSEYGDARAIAGGADAGGDRHGARASGDRRVGWIFGNDGAACLAVAARSGVQGGQAKCARGQGLSVAVLQESAL